MNNGYAPQGTFHVNDRIVWQSDVAPRHNGKGGVIAKVTPYGDVLDLLWVAIDGEPEGAFVPAHSTDVVTEDEFLASVA